MARRKKEPLLKDTGDTTEDGSVQKTAKKSKAIVVDNPVDNNVLSVDFVKLLNSHIIAEAKLLDIDLEIGLGNNKFMLSSGSLAYDLIAGGGFVYPGRRTNLFGKEQGGKSLFSYYAIKDAIDKKVVVIFYDYEGTTELSRLEKIGVKVDWSVEKKNKEPVYFWYVNDLVTGEQAFRHSRRIMRKLPKRKDGYPSLLIVLDSIPAMNPQVSDEKDESKQTAQLAAMLSREFPKVKSLLASRRVSWLDTNQLRDRPGHSYGTPEYEVGGYATRHYGDIRTKVTRVSNPNSWGKGIIEEEKSIEGGTDRYNYIKVDILKNKLFVPFKSCYVRVLFEHNSKPYGIIDPFYDVYEYLTKTGQLVRGSKRMLTVSLEGYEGTYQWSKFKKLVLENKDEIYALLREQLFSGKAVDLLFSTDSGLSAEDISKDDVEDIDDPDEDNEEEISY